MAVVDARYRSIMIDIGDFDLVMVVCSLIRT